MCDQCGFEIVNCEEDREITGGVYCCDLLSFVMGRAPADGAWFTVMGNLNAVAVASLSDVACIVLCEGSTMDEPGLAKAKEQGINICRAAMPIFQAAHTVFQKL
jgi:hypothetical protein